MSDPQSNEAAVSDPLAARKAVAEMRLEGAQRRIGRAAAGGEPRS